MKPNKEIDSILSLIDEILPPESHPIIEEISGLVMPQFEFIVEASRLDVPHGRSEWDTHHTFWPRSEYTTRTERAFRRSFQLPINRAIHNNLHAELEPPKMPPRSLMLGYLAILDKKT